jgi:hypothetical protein
LRRISVFAFAKTVLFGTKTSVFCLAQNAWVFQESKAALQEQKTKASETLKSENPVDSGQAAWIFSGIS